MSNQNQQNTNIEDLSKRNFTSGSSPFDKDAIVKKGEKTQAEKDREERIAAGGISSEISTDEESKLSASRSNEFDSDLNSDSTNPDYDSESDEEELRPASSARRTTAKAPVSRKEPLV